MVKSSKRVVKSKSKSESKRGGFINNAVSAVHLGQRSTRSMSKQHDIPCGQTKMFVNLNERIKKVLDGDGTVNKIIKEGDFERVIISGKGFSRSPQPLMEGEWQLKVVKADESVKYIVIINKSILKFEKFCKYQTLVQNISEGDEIELVCLDRDGSKHTGSIPGKAVKSNKFILHKFRTGEEGVLAFVAEFL